MRKALLLVGTWLAAAALLWLASRGADWAQAWRHARAAHGGWLALAVLLNLAILPLWAFLWRGFVPRAAPRPPFRTFFDVAAITSAIMNTVPMLAGHASAVMLLAQRARLGLPVALSILALDQLGEGLSKLAVFSTAALHAPLPEWMRAGIVSVALVVAVLFVTLLVLAHRAPGRARSIPIVGPAIVHLGEGATPLRSPAHAVRSLAVVLAMKGAEALAIFGVMRAFGVELPLASALVVLSAVNLATMLPLAPANLGAYEAAAAATWRWLGVPPDQALAIAVVQHACFLLPAIGVGVLVLGLRVGPFRAGRIP